MEEMKSNSSYPINESMKINVVFNIALLYVYIQPYILSTLISGTLTKIIKLICSGIIIALFIYYKRTHVYKSLMLRSSIFAAIMFITTMLNGGDWDDCILAIVEIFTVLCFTFMMTGKRQKFALKCLVGYYLFVTFINNLIMIIRQGSIYVGSDVNNQINFLGTDNYMGTVMIPAFIITIYYLRKYNKLDVIKFVLCAVFYMFPIFYVNSSTSIVALSACTLLLIFLYKNDSVFTRTITYFRLLILMIVVFLLITVFNSGIFNWFIVNVLGKTVTFSARSRLWQLALTKAAASPITGYGYGSQAFSGIGFYENLDTTPHSAYLTLLLYGGIILLIIFIFVLLSSFKGIRKYWNDVPEIRILTVGIVGFMLYWLAEWRFNLPGLWMLLALIEMEVNNQGEDVTPRKRLRIKL